MASKKSNKAEVFAFQIMTKPVESVLASDPIHNVVELFTEKNISAAAVLDQHGKPVGVITKTDLVRYEHEMNGTKMITKKELPQLRKNEIKETGYHVIDDDEIIQNWMTPVIFNVKPETTLKEIAQKMVRYGIHHIFVKGKNGEPISGIVSSFDILRQVAGSVLDPGQ